MTEQRRLAAILVADVVGYSKLMGSDEAGTLAQLEALRTEVIEPQIAKHAGWLFKFVGDGRLGAYSDLTKGMSALSHRAWPNGLQAPTKVAYAAAWISATPDKAREG